MIKYLLSILIIGVSFIQFTKSYQQCGQSNVYCQKLQTCCNLKGQWGCCPYNDATCCPDQLNCCPKGQYCISGGCSRSLQTNNHGLFLADIKEVETLPEQLRILTQQPSNKKNNTNIKHFTQGFFRGFLAGINSTGIVNCTDISKFQFGKIQEAIHKFLRNEGEDRLWAIQSLGYALIDIPYLVKNCSNIQNDIQVVIKTLQRLNRKWSKITLDMFKNLLLRGGAILQDVELVRKAYAEKDYQTVGYGLGHIFVYEIIEPAEIDLDFFI